MQLRCEALDFPVWRAWLGPDEGGQISLGGPGVAALESLLERASASAHCRALVIGSEGASVGEFCRGMDLQALASGADPAARGEAVARFARVLRLLRELPAATLCLVEGAASGGGVGLAAACDLVIAGPGASFILPELYFGLVPAVVLPVIAERVGLPRARWLAMTGERLDAEAAVRLGLADERHDDPDRVLVGRLKHLLRISPDALARLKRFSAAIAGAPLADALAAGVARTGADVQGPEVAAAVAAFLAGELPPWAVRARGGGPV